MKKYFSDSSIALCSKAFSINFFYTFATYSPSIFEPNDAILNQLKNSGSLRYFKDQELQELTGKLSVAISKLKNRNEMEWTQVHEIINPFYLKHNDQNWVDKIDHDSGVFTFVALQKYENSDEQIPFHFQKPDKFDKVEAINIVGLYQLTFRGTLRKQYHDYETLNAKLLEALRKEYKMK
jgi:preprotein translocase subunit SecA